MAISTVQTDKVNTLDTNKSSKSNFLSFIGAHEIFMPLAWVAALRELVLNCMLMFMQTGSIMGCLDSNEVVAIKHNSIVEDLLLLNKLDFEDLLVSKVLTLSV
ncbi:uncharacterized protein LOC130970753 [Arachis stenosperma]|uniref:uncharacterized protein LOC130970753 n=1 Tax=Arachis stenosperma TaxID=217475 RepID=UPI0025AB6BF7|nr:uncharacterized protein LOC130970753 [Arachis stenosperma]